MKILKLIPVWILAGAELFMSLWLYAPVRMGILNVGGIFGGTVFLLLFFVTVFFGRFKRLVLKIWRKKAGKAALSVISLLLIIGCSAAATFTGFMITARCNTPDVDVEVVIVLGCKINPDGNPSLMLGNRIAAAAEFLDSHPNAICVASGGQGDDEPLPEGQVIYERLVELGIPSERIIIEENSGNTSENIKFSLEMLKDRGMDTENLQIAIVTDGFHQLRAKLIAEKNGVEARAVNADTPLIMLPAYWVREWFGLCRLIFLGR